MNVKIIAVFFGFLFSKLLFAESLSEVYLLALQNDYQLKSAESAYSAGQENESIAKSELLPKIYADAVLTRSETTSEIHSTNPFAPKTKSVQLSNNPSYTISLSQPLIDFSAFHNYSRGQIVSKIAKVQFEIERQSLIMRTTDAYLQILKAGAKLAAAQSAEDAFALQLKVAKQKHSVGLARMSDVLEAQAVYDSVVADGVVATNNLNVSFDLLGVMTSRNHKEIAKLNENLVASVPVPVDFKEWEEFAVKNNLERNKAQLSTDLLYQDYKVKMSQHLPKVTLNLQYTDGYDDRNYNNAIPERAYQKGLGAALALSIPIYSGDGISASAREANYLYMEQRDKATAMNRQILQKTHSIYLSVVAGVAAVNARKTAIISSQSALRYAQKGYEQGVGSMLDLLDAQKILYQANQGYSDALYDYLSASLKLKEVAGILSINDVDELNAQLDKEKKIYIH